MIMEGGGKRNMPWVHPSHRIPEYKPDSERRAAQGGGRAQRPSYLVYEEESYVGPDGSQMTGRVAKRTRKKPAEGEEQAGPPRGVAAARRGRQGSQGGGAVVGDDDYNSEVASQRSRKGRRGGAAGAVGDNGSQADTRSQRRDKRNRGGAGGGVVLYDGDDNESQAQGRRGSKKRGRKGAAGGAAGFDDGKSQGSQRSRATSAGGGGAGGAGKRKDRRNRQNEDYDDEDDQVAGGAAKRGRKPKGGQRSPSKKGRKKGKKGQDDDDDILAGYPVDKDGKKGDMETPEEDPLIEPVMAPLIADDDIGGPTHLSYKGVKHWQYKMHPRDPETKLEYDWWNADISFLPLFKKQVKITEWVTPEAKAIGLGPVLYLHTMKVFAWLFVFFTILNIPLFMFYVNGQGPTAGKQGTGQFTDVFGALSIGNLGVSDFTCSNFNAARTVNKLRFNCKYGTLRELFEFGMQKIDNQSCVRNDGNFIGEGDTWNDLQPDCNMENGLTPEGRTAMFEQFDKNCYNKYECTISVDVDEWITPECTRRIEYYAAGSRYRQYADQREWDYWQRDAFRREPVFFGTAFCIADEIYHPFTGTKMGFQKQTFGYFICFVDLIIVVSTILMINLLEVRYKEYAKIFDKRNVEMRDFTVQIYNLPTDMLYGGKDVLLQTYLWEHIENHTQEAFIGVHEKNKNQKKLDELNAEKPWQVVDINFGTSDNKEQELLTKMDDEYRNKIKKIHKQNQMKKEENAAEKAEDIQLLSDEIIEHIKEYKEAKAEYINMQEEKLYDKYEMTEANGKTDEDVTIVYAYVTFRSMKGKDRCINTFSHVEDLAKKDPKEDEKKFMENYLEIEEALPPGAIQWQNITYTRCNRLTRSCIIWILAMVLVLIAFYLMIWFKDYNDSLKMTAKLDAACPSEPLEIQEVYDDWSKAPKQRQGYVHCYCLSIKDTVGVAAAMKNFTEVDPDIPENPCEEWLWIYENAMILTVLSGAMVGAINGIVCFIFEAVAPFEKCLCYTDEDRGIFERITMIQFLNIGALFIFSDFTLGFDRKSFSIPILVGNHKDFDTAWYYEVGAKISMAMVSNSIAPHGGKFAEPFIKKILRWFLDRCCKKHLLRKTNIEEEQAKAEANKKPEEATPEEDKKDDEKEGGQDGEPTADGELKNPDDIDCHSDECETQLVFQDEINRLYTGEPVKIWYLYAWFFTNLLIYYLYGAGMPMMYILAILFFTTSYLNYKWLFFTWYQKSHGFNEDVALYSLGFLKWALLFHLGMGMMMYTNKRLLTPDGYNPAQHYRPKGEEAGSFFRRRFDNSYNFLVAIIVFVVIFCYLFWKTIIKGILYILAVRKEKRKQLQEEEEEAKGGDEEAMAFKQQNIDDHSDDFYRELKIEALRDHYVRSNKEYEIVRTMLNAQSYDPEKLSDDQARFIKKKLKERVQMIEDTVDIHLNLIGGLEKYIERSYMYKLLVLEANEERIQAKFEKSLRMVDHMQSYNLYDAEHFFKEKQIVAKLDREILQMDYQENELPVEC